MELTNVLNTEIKNFLNGGGIIVEDLGNILSVNRNSMCQAFPSQLGWEQEYYDITLKMIKEYIGDCYPTRSFLITWGGKTDDVLYLNIYEKEI